MKPLPHHYLASAHAAGAGDVLLSSPGVPDLTSDSPAEFGGSGERWSPETLLCGAVADCFILTFRALARARSLTITSIRCDVSGQLDKVDHGLRFTTFTLRVHLTVPAGTETPKARELLERAERSCLISRSLVGTIALEAEVVEEVAAEE